MKKKLQPLISIARDFTSRMGERKLPIYATSGCYYLFMSLVPIAMIFCCILPYTPFRQEIILNYIDMYFAESLGDIVRRIVNAVYSSNASTLTVSIVLTLYSASASMKSLMNGMDAAYHCKKKDNFIVFTIRALFYMVFLVAMLLVALVIMVFGGRILSLLNRYFAHLGFLSVILSRSRYLLVMLILFLVFIALYTLMPAEKVRLLDQIPGALFSALIWVVFSAVFTIYVDISDKYGAYGIIGTVMVTMMWGYYCLFFLLIGGFLNSYLTDYRRRPVETVPQLPETLPSQKKEKGSDSAIISNTAETSSAQAIPVEALSSHDSFNKDTGFEAAAPSESTSADSSYSLNNDFEVASPSESSPSDVSFSGKDDFGAATPSESSSSDVSFSGEDDFGTTAPSESSPSDSSFSAGDDFGAAEPSGSSPSDVSFSGEDNFEAAAPSDQKKKLPIPLIAGLGAVVAALLAALIIVLRKRKKY